MFVISNRVRNLILRARLRFLASARNDSWRAGLVLLTALSLLVVACSAPSPSTPTASAKPEWFAYKMVDVRTGESFSMNDFAGKVVLIETMAEWCPTCRHQEDQVKKLHTLIGNSSDLVSISLDVDLNEDAASLRKYADAFGYDWYFAIAPLEVQRALGNLYSAQYLNPPVAPILLIDREGKQYGLPYGVKSAEALQKTIAPYLAR